MTTGERQCYIIVCYFTTNKTLTIESFITGLKECPQGAELLEAGDLNANLADPEGEWRD